MNDSLRHEVAVYIYAFIGNTRFNNEDYRNSLVKKYGRKTVNNMIADIRENGSFSDALRSGNDKSNTTEKKHVAA